jgi:hypothetical protein
VAEELIELGRACRKGEIRRKGYVTQKGVRVPPACVQDQGFTGKTPTAAKWFPDDVDLPGWSKGKTSAQRHAALKKLVGKKPCKRILSDMNAIANVTADRATKTKMRADRRWLKKQGVCKL